MKNYKMKKTEMNDVLDDVLSPETKSEKTELDVLKELFKLKEIETKTELSIQQVILINQKRMIAELLGWDSLEFALNDFMLLMVSHQRKGRAEFVDGFKSDREQKVQQSGGGFFKNLQNRMNL